MQLFLKLFAPHLQWFYHCFDRIVINGCLSYFTREINAAWFFRQVCRKPKVTKEVLTQRTRAYQAWVAAYAGNHGLPLEWARKGERKEDLVRPRQQRMIRQNRFGVFRKWTTAQLHEAVLDAYDLKAGNYTLTQLRYDARKLRLHGLIERVPKSYAYRFTPKGTKLSILLIQLRRRIYGPLGFGLFRTRPNPEYMPDSRFEKAYLKVEEAMDNAIALMAA